MISASEHSIDLHIHSTYSDGLLNPQQIVALAWERRLRAISITDHDIESAAVFARSAAEDLDLEVIPGIEFSSDFRDEDIHILGYFIAEGHQIGRAHV